MTDNLNEGQALRPAEGGCIQVKLDEQAARLRRQLDDSGRDREAVSLVKDYGLNVMMMSLRQGVRLHEHITKGPLALQVISGRINFKVNASGVAIEVAAGSMVALDREIIHSVEALEDSTLLLTTAIG
jgi:quercetin dioxygenase-like cupin family protein